MVAISDNPVFQDADKAREFLESLLWPDGPICPHCGLIGCSNQFHGKAHRPGVYKCKGCEKQYTVTVGTVMERSHIPLHKWLLIIHLMYASKKGVSAHQIHRMLKLTYKSAWFACHRVRAAMTDGTLPEKLGGPNKVVEVDETPQIAETALRALGAPPEVDRSRAEIGSIEGDYLYLGDHYAHPALKILERKTGAEVWCWVSETDLERFSELVKAADVWRHKRVRARGKILYDRYGGILHVEAHDVQLTEVPHVRLDEVRDPNFTGGLSASEYLNRLREGSLG